MDEPVVTEPPNGPPAAPAPAKPTQLTMIRDALVVTLTLLTGATDAIAFIKLGSVFTSVMTGNMVLLGLAIGRGTAGAVARISIAFFAYALGSILGGRLAGRPKDSDGVWPLALTGTLIVEFALFLTFGILWWGSDASPGPDLAAAMVGICALALGLQSSAVLRFGISGLSTTYLTGTLTLVMNSIATGRRLRGNGRATLTLLALIGGAALGSVTATKAAELAPLIPLALLGATIVIAHVLCTRRDPGRPA